MASSNSPYLLQPQPGDSQELIDARKKLETEYNAAKEKAVDGVIPWNLNLDAAKENVRTILAANKITDLVSTGDLALGNNNIALANGMSVADKGITVVGTDSDRKITAIAGTINEDGTITPIQEQQMKSAIDTARAAGISELTFPEGLKQKALEYTGTLPYKGGASYPGIGGYTDVKSISKDLLYEYTRAH